MARKRLSINNGQVGILTTTFSRNIATVDDFAQAVSANNPRYGRAQAISDYTPWASAFNPQSASEQVFLGASKSADGTQDLICFFLPQDHTFNVVKDHNFSSPFFYTHDITRTDHTVEIDDILTITDQTDAAAWTPRAGVICHGLLVLRCNVSDWISSAWVVRATGIVSFAINSNGTLTYLRRDRIDDPDSLFFDHTRGAYWSMTGYTPDPHYTDPPLAAWFAITDYAGNSQDDPPSSYSPGGYAMIMRATRSSVSSAWVPEQAVMIHSCVFLKLTGNPADGNTVTITVGTTPYVFEFDSNSSFSGTPVAIGANATASVNNLITTINATLPSNGMTRAVKDSSGDIAVIQGIASVTTTGTNIAFTQLGRHFHSAVVQVKNSTTIDVLISIGDSAQNQSIVVRCTNKASYTNSANWTTYNHGIDGHVNQWAGGVLGPDDNHIVGADLTFESILSAQTPDTNTNPGTALASLDYLFGVGPSTSLVTGSLWAHTDCPEKRRNYVSLCLPNINIPPDPAVCFSPDGRAWCMIANFPSGAVIPFISGDRIYLTSGYQSGGILYIPIPQTRICRPLRLGPGGKQWVKSTTNGGWSIDGTEEGIGTVPLNKGENGKWQDDDIDLPGQPPIQGRVLKVVNTGTNQFEGRDWIAGVPEDTPHPDNGKIFVRWWGMPLKGRHISVTATLECGFALANGYGGLGAATQFSACPATFTPHLLMADITNDPNQPNYGRWLGHNGLLQDANYYFASDLFVTGSNPVPGYPMPEGRNTTHPDEQFTVSGLALESQWTVAIYCIMPWDSWDSVYSLVTEVPLWTLYTDDNNYIAVVADIANDQLVFRVNGTSNSITLSDMKFWRCCPVVICISRTESGIEVTVRVFGNFKSGNTASAPTVSSSTRIQFGSPDSPMSRVTALDVADVIIETSSGLDEAGRKSLMAEAAGATLFGVLHLGGGLVKFRCTHDMSYDTGEPVPELEIDFGAGYLGATVDSDLFNPRRFDAKYEADPDPGEYPWRLLSLPTALVATPKFLIPQSGILVVT